MNRLTNWARCVVYSAGMQGACNQDIADKVIVQFEHIHLATSNTPESCLGMSMRIYNKLGHSHFNENLITYLMS